VKFVAVNGALLGAPVMLARALGLEPTQFIRWSDQPKLLATAPFAGAYALLPAPWEGRLFNGPNAIDIFDPYYYGALGLGLQNMRETAALWSDIQAGAPRASVDYVLITSRLDDGSTIERVRYIGGAWTREYGPGDGSVPPWSSQGIPSALIVPPLPGEHLGVIHTAAFRDLFSQHVAPLPPGPQATAVLLQPLKQHLRPGSVAEFSVVRQDAGLGAQGRLTWTAVSDRGARIGPPVRTEDIAIPDQAAPVVRSRTPDAVGNYDVTLVLGAASSSTRVGVRPATEQPTAPTSAPAAAPTGV
jgi:hypothetical protein